MPTKARRTSREDPAIYRPVRPGRGCAGVHRDGGELLAHMGAAERGGSDYEEEEVMGVYVKGLDMPIKCEHCMLAHEYEAADGVAYGCLVTWKTREKNVEYRPDWCPLVSVPRGARLISAGDLMARAFRYLLMNGEESPKVVFASAIKDAPTVIWDKEQL